MAFYLARNQIKLWQQEGMMCMYTLLREDFMGENYCNFMDRLQLTYSPCDHFTLAKSCSLLSTVVPVSAMLSMIEVVKKLIDNNMGPEEEKTACSF